MKHSLQFIAVTLLLLSFTKASYSNNYYVSPVGNDSWSGKLPAPNGNGDGPFRTIARAVSAMRSRAVPTTYVRDGEYFQNGVSILLNANNSGDQLLAYPGEHPIISGGFRVIDWRKEPSIAGAWSAPLPAEFDTSSPTGMPPEVSFNGDWMDCARTPNVAPGNRYQSGFFYAAGPVNPLYPPDYGTDHTFTFRNTDITPQMYNGEPTAGVVMWDKLGWSCDPMPISSIDFSTNTVNLVTGSQFGISNDSRYFIYGTKGSLDEPGEYFMDAVGRRLWIIPLNGENPNGATVVISESEGPAVIEIDGANDALIAGLQIRDQDNSDRWMNSVANYAPQKGGVRIDNGQSDIIEDNIISCTGIGVDLEGANAGGAGAVGTLIYDNEIFDTVCGGLNLSGTGDMAVGNFIHDIGLFEEAGRGIWSAPAPNYIGYNLLDNTPHNAVISGNGSPPADGLLVEYNSLLHTSQGDHDTGAVYLVNAGNYTASNPETVRYNSFRDTGGFIAVADPNTGAISTYFPNFSWAVYLDNGQSGTDIYGNLVNISGDGGVFAHEGTNNSIYNNVFANSTGYELVMQGTSGNDPLSNVFTNNIFYGSVPTDPILVEQAGTQGLLSKNVWWNPAYTSYDMPSSPFVDYNDGTATQTYTQWQAAGEDAGSQQADPLFVNPGIDDFALQAGSPAFGEGFQALPLSQMGPQGYTQPTMQIDCGSASGANGWQGDVGVTGGTDNSYGDAIDTAVPNSAPAAVYDTFRSGVFTYTISHLAPESEHVVRLHFAEEYYGVPGRGAGGAGMRIFNVLINGKVAIGHLDVYAAAGGPDIAYVQEFLATANASGKIPIHFEPITGSPDRNAICNGIEIDPPAAPRPAVQINASGGAIGNWSADGYYEGGSWNGVSDPIDTSFAYHPAPAGVYDTYRYGTFSYTIPGFAPGSNHLVRLHFAESWYGVAGRGGGTGAGARLFNVTINGEPALTNFDVYAAAGGPDTAVTRQFMATAGANGTIVVSFAPAAGSFDQNAIVSGIEAY